MRSSCLIVCAAGSLVVTAITSVCSANPPTPTIESATAETASYVSPQGERYFAMAVRPELKRDAESAAEILILFDTSASQAGAYRARGMEVLRQLFAALDADDRVKLMGVDLNAISLHQQFERADSAAVKDALRKLQRRVPLGSTDFDVALRAVAEQFSDAAQTRRAVVYIGDGVNGVATEDRSSLNKQLAGLSDRQISFFSYGVGPRVDATFLSSLAVATGGRFVADQSVALETSRGRLITDMIGRPVAWRPKIHWPAELTQVLPNPLPPLRADQTAIILGKGTPTSDAQLTIKAVVADQPTTLRCNVAATEPDGSHAYLVDLHRSAASGDLSSYFPVQGLQGLRGMLSVHGHRLGRLAENALATGNRPAARRLAQRALRADADNAGAAAVLSVLDRDSVDRPANFPDGDSDLLGRVRHERQRRTESLRARVNATLNDARRRMSSEPGQVEAELKALLDSLQSAIDVDSDVRMGLTAEATSAIRSARRMEIVAAERQRDAMEIQAQQVARQDLLDNAARDEQKTSQLMARFTSLMKENRHQEAFDIAYEAASITAGDSAIAAASLTAVQSRILEETMAIQRQRQHGTALAMLDVERAGITMSGDSPIVYPDAETWDALSRRRAQYLSLDMQQRGRREQEILEQLNEPTRIDFEEVPFQEVVDFLSDYHDIELVLDHHALGELGLGGDTRVSFRVRGISLRSALRLMLRSIDPALAFTVQDEVLRISTKEELENDLETRSYPVADLVLPIQDLNFAGLGGMSSGARAQGFGSDAFGPRQQGGNQQIDLFPQNPGF